MQLKEITKKSDDYINVKKLYNRAFPAEEKAPFWLMMKKTKKENVDFWGLYDKEKWIGLAYVIRYNDLAYLFYLAIDDSQRGKGYGTKVMKLLQEKYMNFRLFLALETLDKNADNYNERVKRHNFYKRAGLTELPYHLREATVVYDIMGTNGKIEPEEYGALISDYIGGFLSKIFRMRIEK